MFLHSSTCDVHNKLLIPRNLHYHLPHPFACRPKSVSAHHNPYCCSTRPLEVFYFSTKELKRFHSPFAFHLFLISFSTTSKYLRVSSVSIHKRGYMWILHVCLTHLKKWRWTKGDSLIGIFLTSSFLSFMYHQWHDEYAEGQVEPSPQRLPFA